MKIRCLQTQCPKLLECKLSRIEEYETKNDNLRSLVYKTGTFSPVFRGNGCNFYEYDDKMENALVGAIRKLKGKKK